MGIDGPPQFKRILTKGIELIHLWNIIGKSYESKRDSWGEQASQESEDKLKVMINELREYTIQ